MKRSVRRLVVRLSLAAVLSVAVWLLAIVPFDRLPLPVPAILAIFRVVYAPVGVVSEVLYGPGPCEFCSPGDHWRRHLSVAIPVYMFLLSLPALWRFATRGNARLRRRISITFAIYALLTAGFLAMSGGDRRYALITASLWLLVLAASAAVAWSPLGDRVKLATLAAILCAGAWLFAYVDMHVVPKIDGIAAYYLPTLFLLVIGVSTTLSLAWTIDELTSRTSSSPSP